MFERFTQAAREVVITAQTEATEMRQSPIGTQHLLLALVTDESGAVAIALRPAGVDAVFVRDEIIKHLGAPAADLDPLPDADAEDTAALKAIGIDLDQVRRTIEENFGPGALRLPREDQPKRRGFFGRMGARTPFSPRSKKVLELSLREAIRLKQNYIAPEHIMLGVLRDGEGLASRILADAEVDTTALRTELTRALQARAA